MGLKSRARYKLREQKRRLRYGDLCADPWGLSGRLDLGADRGAAAEAGHLVYARSLDGCADRRHQLRPGITVETQAAEIAELLFYEDLNDVVLTGTSSGGMVSCQAAELARERIGRLVFVDALALLDGERVARSSTARRRG